ncbi:unnamed protein product [Amoebophrya sp. A25]|nr:unnamed protein product [Amoebophrya sp. A25]|eukprot:GSA25T00015062001.1
MLASTYYKYGELGVGRVISSLVIPSVHLVDRVLPEELGLISSVVASKSQDASKDMICGSASSRYSCLLFLNSCATNVI